MALNDTESKMEAETDVELPAGTVPLEHQVAGHRIGQGSMVMLKCENGQIMKHVQPPPKGMREVEFYRRMFVTDLRDPVLLTLRDFIPTFHGTVPEEPTEHEKFFKMEDVTRRYRKPCITDIKMGKFTYDPYASAKKRHYEVAKYPPVLNLGFQMLGMRVYRSSTGQFDVYDRKYGRSLDEDQVLEKGLAVYFNGQDCLRKDVIRVILAKMKEILLWFESQKQLAFYASSLLLIYEGDQFQGTSSDNLESYGSRTCMQPSNSSLCTSVKHDKMIMNIEATDTENGLSQSASTHDKKNGAPPSASIADVRMIDFAHVFDSETQDDNYLFGLRNLISHIEQLLDM